MAVGRHAPTHIAAADEARHGLKVQVPNVLGHCSALSTSVPGQRRAKRVAKCWKAIGGAQHTAVSGYGGPPPNSPRSTAESLGLRLARSRQPSIRHGTGWPTRWACAGGISPGRLVNLLSNSVAVLCNLAMPVERCRAAERVLPRCCWRELTCYLFEGC